jgi:Flp pilus assembly protein TadG
MRLLNRIRRAGRKEDGSSLVEFAISLPLLVVFVVGIYDFSGAFNQKQKIEQAAQVGAIIAAGTPNGDIESATSNPDSLQPVVSVVFNTLADANVLPLANQGGCKPASAVVTGPAGLTWTYTISGCPDTLTIKIDRGWVPATGVTPVSVGTQLTVSYPYQWRFNSVIQLLVPGASYAATTLLTETATVHNQN